METAALWKPWEIHQTARLSIFTGDSSPVPTVLGKLLPRPQGSVAVSHSSHSPDDFIHIKS